MKTSTDFTPTDIDNFKTELRALLAKYDADIYIDLDGDTHGVSAYIIIDMHNKEISRNSDCINQYDLR